MTNPEFEQGAIAPVDEDVLMQAVDQVAADHDGTLHDFANRQPDLAAQIGDLFEGELHGASHGQRVMVRSMFMVTYGALERMYRQGHAAQNQDAKPSEPVRLPQVTPKTISESFMALGASKAVDLGAPSPLDTFARQQPLLHGYAEAMTESLFDPNDPMEPGSICISALADMHGFINFQLSK